MRTHVNADGRGNGTAMSTWRDRLREWAGPRTFHALRTLQLTLWFIERREDPAFEGWQKDVRDGLTDLEAFVRRTAGNVVS
jgi:hypothetical protein